MKFVAGIQGVQDGDPLSMSHNASSDSCLFSICGIQDGVQPFQELQYIQRFDA